MMLNLFGSTPFRSNNKGMSTAQVTETLCRGLHDRVRLLGVFPSDREPSPTSTDKYPCCYVLNTDPSNMPGEHWLAFYCASPASRTEYFDSLGFSRKDYGLADGDYVQVNKKMLQAVNSNMCGEYCVYYLERRSFHQSPELILHNLTSLGSNREKFLNKHIQAMSHYRPQHVIATHLTDPFSNECQQSCKCASCFCNKHE